MPTSISAEILVLVLARVKTKLYNSIGNDRMLDLCILASYPNMVEDINLIDLCNVFLNETSYTGRRNILFGKFVLDDLTCFMCNDSIDLKSLHTCNDNNSSNSDVYDSKKQVNMHNSDKQVLLNLRAI